MVGNYDRLLAHALPHDIANDFPVCQRGREAKDLVVDGRVAVGVLKINFVVEDHVLFCYPKGWVHAPVVIVRDPVAEFVEEELDLGVSCVLHRGSEATEFRAKRGLTGRNN